MGHYPSWLLVRFHIRDGNSYRLIFFFLGYQVYIWAWRQEMGGTSFLWRVAAVIKEIKQFVMALGLEDRSWENYLTILSFSYTSVPGG